MNRFLVGLVCLALSSAAFAEPSKERGAYLGAGFAGTTFDDDGAFAGLNFDDSDSGFALFGGYKFLKYLAVEGRYNNFGTFTLEGAGVDVTSLSVHAVGIIPFGTSGWVLWSLTVALAQKTKVLGRRAWACAFRGPAISP